MKNFVIDISYKYLFVKTIKKFTYFQIKFIFLEIGIW